MVQINVLLEIAYVKTLTLENFTCNTMHFSECTISKSTACCARPAEPTSCIKGETTTSH